MSDITEIVSEITNNINIVLNKSLNKIISREDDVNIPLPAHGYPSVRAMWQFWSTSACKLRCLDIEAYD